MKTIFFKDIEALKQRLELMERELNIDKIKVCLFQFKLKILNKYFNISYIDSKSGKER